MKNITKREEVGYAWATIIISFLREMPKEERKEYRKRFVKEIKKYIFYSTEESNGNHPRSIQERKPKLIAYDYKNPKSYALFIARQLEEGLVKRTSERKREYLTNHLEKLMKELK